MEKMLRQLETFKARGSDGKTYTVRGYEHLARPEAAYGADAGWEPTGVAEYKLDDGRRVLVDRKGAMTIESTGTTLQREDATQTA